MLYGGSKGFTSGAAIGRALRVKLTAGKLALAGASDADLGFTETISFAADEHQTVRLRTAEGTVMGVADEALPVGADAWAAADGRLAATGTVMVGTVLTPATAQGDYVEILRS